MTTAIVANASAVANESAERGCGGVPQKIELLFQENNQKKTKPTKRKWHTQQPVDLKN